VIVKGETGIKIGVKVAKLLFARVLLELITYSKKQQYKIYYPDLTTPEKTHQDLKNIQSLFP